MADYRVKLYLDEDVVDVTCTDHPDDFKAFLDSFSSCNFAIFNNGPNGYIAVHMSHVTKIEATKLN